MYFVRFALAGLIFMFVVACGKNFHAKSPPISGAGPSTLPTVSEHNNEVEDIGEFYRVKENPKTPSSFRSNKVKIANREYKIERERLRFSNLSYAFKDGQLFVRGQTILNSQTENFEMTGKIENEIADLKLTDSHSPYRDRLKARATCYSLSQNSDKPCERFFVDFYYYDQGVFYTEQLIPKFETPQKEDKPEEKAPEKAPVENDDIGSSAPGFFSVRHDQDILELYPDLTAISGEAPVPPKVQPPDSTTPNPLPTPEPLPQPPQAPTPAKPPVERGKPPTAKPPVKKPSRPMNQAIGGGPERVADGTQVISGSLRNATSLMDVLKQMGNTAGFDILSPNNERYYGTWDTIQMIKKMAAWVRVNVAGQLIYVRDISTKNGGKLPPHVSHQNGLDADIAYFSKNKDKSKVMTSVVDKNVNKVSSDLMLEEQLKLFKFVLSQDEANIIIVDHVVKKALCQKARALGEIMGAKDNELTVRTLHRIKPDYSTERDHVTHFHLRMLCGPYNRACNSPDLTAVQYGLGCDEK